MAQPGKHGETQVVTERVEQVKEPAWYKVLLHNDDYTTMEFVIMILETIFKKNQAEATRIMLSVHHQGIGVAGIFPLEIAETKASAVHDLARQHQFPLRCSVEKA